MSINSAFRDAYNLAFQVSPIILTGGAVGLMPVIGLTGQLAALLQGGAGLEDFYATYLPIPGSNVINNAVGTYPFANQQVAANAIIEQPKHISLLMIAPVRAAGGYLSKLAIFTSLQTAFQNHNRAGGTYTIMTPAFIYTNCVMTAMTDVTGGDTKQRQVQWQIDFFKPLISLSDAQNAQNNLMGALTGGQVVTSSANSQPSANAANSAINFLASPI
jgi:hypothetical protein